MDLPVVVAAVILVSLIAYVVTGGADFGGGIWELLARGPRADEQRRALRNAIAPIWEAHHVWLIVAVVLLFVGFPRAFAAIMTALHIPLVLMLIGVVLRGAAFAFRSYSAGARATEARWARVFAIASVATPIALGVVAGAIAAAELPVDPATGLVVTDFVSAWTGAFPLAVGLYLVVLCAFLAATYMTEEVAAGPLREDFRRRALGAGVALGAVALLALVAARVGAPVLYERLVGAEWSLPFHAATGAVSLAALAALWRRRYRVAQVLAIVQAGAILTGGALAVFPYWLRPDLTVWSSAAPDHVLGWVLIVLAAGAALLAPALFVLYRVFKGRPWSETSHSG